MVMYVHGYDLRESIRLQDQARTLEELLHADTGYGKGERILEAGCGVGAQTVTLAQSSPEASIISIDISEESVIAARKKVESLGLTNVQIRQGDIFKLDFEFESFDHIFVCFVLEHLPEPVRALKILKNYLKPGGTITLIEGDHGSTFFHPDSEAAKRAINSQVVLQHNAGGNANIGRELYPLLTAAEYREVRVSPRNVYVDGSRPDLITGFTRNTFTAMIEGVRDSAIAAGIITAEEMAVGIDDLYRTAAPDGVFSYTFFKGIAVK